MIPSRSSNRVRCRAIATWMLGLFLLTSGRVDAQYYGGTTYYGGAGYLQWPLVQFPAVQFPLVQFPAYMGIANNYYYGYPYGYYNPYAYWENWAAADTYRMAKYGMASARYNTMAESAATTAMANALLNREAFEEMGWRGGGTGYTGRYNVHTGRAAGATASRPEANRSRLLELTSRDGDVLWPISAPVKGDLFNRRREASRAIKDVLQQYRAKGNVPVDGVVHALQALYAYASPAAERMRDSRSADTEPFLSFIADLDSGLRALSSEPIPADAGATPRPASNAPKP